jgi:beta-N-acetylhexosaminidase
MEGLLRDSLGFEGVAITDEMFMGAILQNYDMEDAFALAVKGGADIVLTARWEMETKTGETRRVSDAFVDYLEEKVNEGFIPAARIEEAYRRVTALKELIGVPRATSVQTRAAAPSAHTLSPNYPNPFNGETRVTVTLPESSAITLAVYDALGRETARLADGRHPAGELTFRWKPDGAASGAYFIRLTTERGATTRTAIYLK